LRGLCSPQLGLLALVTNSAACTTAALRAGILLKELDELIGHNAMPAGFSGGDIFSIYGRDHRDVRDGAGGRVWAASEQANARIKDIS
jgi:hypothetical protein